MFTKILIANRGEIACRVMRTAQKMGIKTVAVYSDADHGAPHMRQADEAVHIGPPPAAESYLVMEKIINAAVQTGSQAIHPGYGFLSENAQFTQMCKDAGIVFIGPTAQTMQSMGSKSAAKDLMEAAGVPTSPGYQGVDQSLETFRTHSNKIGYPVLLKAVSGGGGKGMRLVTREEDLEEAISSAQREGKASFGDDRLLIEKYIERARHLEVQIFGDTHGNVVHLFERDCSVQRRHQKIIEEAPAPNLPLAVREKLLNAGVAAGRAVDYVGAGTVEFLYDGQDQVYFMEMNTRLQVEHPVSEAITGLDFVEWQLRVAAGENLPLTQEQIHEKGHAFESRLYAENPATNFSPSTGTLTTLRFPNPDETDIRIDSGVEQGQDITPFYDPMIAKIITYAENRKQALGKMRLALRETFVTGLETNTAFLHALSSEKDFIEGHVSTHFIEDHETSLFETVDHQDYPLAAWLLWTLNHGEGNQSEYIQDKTHHQSPWGQLKGWRLNRPNRQVFWIENNNAPTVINLTQKDNLYTITIEENADAQSRRKGADINQPRHFTFSGEMTSTHEASITINHHTQSAFIAPHQKGTRIFINAQHVDILPSNPLSGNSNQAATSGSLNAPMPGNITAILKAPDDTVAAGDTLMVMEAMKMEHAIKAPHNGTVKAFRFDIGDQVKDGDLLVEFEETE